MSFALQITGAPVPSGRPRFRRIGKGVSTYPDPRDRPGKARVVAAWRAAGCPALPAATAYVVDMHVTVARPATHWLRSGLLSAAGRRVLAPPGDVDNYLKLATDALVAVGAIPDDRLCTRMACSKAWATDPGHPGSTSVVVTQATETQDTTTGADACTPTT